MTMNSTGSGRGARRPALSFLAVLAFVASFLLARLFATIYPDIVIVRGEIHLHHFWYGLALLAIAGWLGIVWRSSERLERIYAIIYGVGAGLIGDEVGLLLTFGDYQSELTFVFFVASLSFAFLGILLLQYREPLKREFLQLARGERTIEFGIFVAGISSVLFAASITIIGFAIAATGGVIILLGILRSRSRRSETSG